MPVKSLENFLPQGMQQQPVFQRLFAAEKFTKINCWPKSMQLTITEEHLQTISVIERLV